MITKEKKAQAIARLKMLDEPAVIAEEMGIPLPLLIEWENNLDPNDIMAMQSHTTALAKVLTGEVVEGSEKILLQRLNEAAVEIATQAHRCAGGGDIMIAKSIDLCANAVAKLYEVFISKGQTQNPTFVPSAQTKSLFQNQMKD